MSIKLSYEQLEEKVKQLESEKSELFGNLSSLEKNEEKYRLLFQYLLHEVHIWELVRDSSGAIKTWRLVDANPVALKSWDKSLPDIIGKTTEEIFPNSRAIDLFLPMIEKMFSENKPAEWERYFQDTNQYLSMVSIPLGDLFFSIGVDVSEQRQREEELKNAHSRLIKSQQLLEETGRIGKVGGWEVNFETGEGRLTDEVKRIHELDLDDEITLEDGINFYSEVSKPIIKKAVQRAIEDNESYDLELEIITAKGNLRNVHAIGIADPDIRRIYGFFQDITERKQADKKLSEAQADLQNTYDVSPGLICVANVNSGYFIKCNPAVKGVLGYSQEEFLAKPFQEFMHPDDRPRSTEEGDNQIEGRSISNFTNRYRCKDGSYKWLSWAGSGVDENGNVHVVATDITELKQAEEEKAKLANLLQQSRKIESVGLLAGGIAHDFNNLLSIIVGNLELLKLRQQSGSPFDENVARVMQASTQAKDLVAQILSFSRQEKPSLVAADLSTIVDDTIKFLRPMIPTTVEVMTVAAAAPLPIRADTTQLQQVLINLCNNAVHAMNEKGLLQIKLEKEDLTHKETSRIPESQSGQYAKLTFTDTGEGMDKETLKRIFDPFFTTKEIGVGTGMGLSVVHGIVEQHGGLILVDSSPGKGSTFTLYFPIASVDEVAEEASVEETLPTGTERILLVDDEPYVADSCGDILQDILGYKVTVMNNSVEALDLFKAHPHDFDLVITDQTMPNMSGVELSKELLSIRPELPVILCSGHSTQADEYVTKEIGISAFCMKPLLMQQLALVVREVLDTRGQASTAD